MSRLGRRVLPVALATPSLLLAGAGPSYAGGFQDCLNKAIDHNGEPPTCTKVNGVWVASWPDSGGAGGGGGAFAAIAAIAVIALLAGIAVMVWKVSTARRLATQAGLDPGLATQVALLTDNGLDATYVASSLRQPGPTTPPPTQVAPVPAPAKEPAMRLAELKNLLDQGVVTQTEYDARRQAIIDSI
jgi:hypothetical protein